MDAFTYYSRSHLPGGLGQEVDATLRLEETLLAEVHASRGIGLALTDSRLIIVRAGLSQTGNPKRRRTAAIALQQVRGLNLAIEGDDEDAQSLQIDTIDPRCPDWARRVPVKRKRIGDVFRLASVFWAKAANLGLMQSLLPGIAEGDLICHNCGAPHSLYTDASAQLPTVDLETLPRMLRGWRGRDKRSN